jgi:hypothetical protein
LLFFFSTPSHISRSLPCLWPASSSNCPKRFSHHWHHPTVVTSKHSIVLAVWHQLRVSARRQPACLLSHLRPAAPFYLFLTSHLKYICSICLDTNTHNHTHAHCIQTNLQLYLDNERSREILVDH